MDAYSGSSHRLVEKIASESHKIFVFRGSKAASLSDAI
jgi:hypothetical protein